MQNQNNKKDYAANIDSNKNSNSVIDNNTDSNKFLTNWAEDESPEHFSGDQQTDEFATENDYNDNLELRMSSPMGGTFMHPMHDATLDPYDNKLGLEAKKLNNEKK